MKPVERRGARTRPPTCSDPYLARRTATAATACAGTTSTSTTGSRATGSTAAPARGGHAGALARAHPRPRRPAGRQGDRSTAARPRFSRRGRGSSSSADRHAPASHPLDRSVRYQGTPRPLAGTWGEVGWEELSDGVIVAGQPDGAPSWFPCNDRPGRQGELPVHGDAPSRRTRSCATACSSTAGSAPAARRGSTSSRSRWRPTSRPCRSAATQIDEHRDRPVPQRGRGAAASAGRVRPRLRAARPQMMTPVRASSSGPTRSTAYTVVVTDDELEIPLEAQGLSVFGANHVDGRRGSERLVAHELAHQWFGNSLTARALAATSGCTRASPATPSGCGRRSRRPASATRSPGGPGSGCQACRRTS